VALVANCAFISACINLGFGRPFTQFNFDNLDIFLLYSNLSGTFSILAALWSKTSFAVTVLRISSGRTKAFVWFIIVTVNACLGVAIVVTWAQCTPIEKIWRPSLEGECWPKDVQVRYNIFTAGELCFGRAGGVNEVLTGCSVFGGDGHCPGGGAVEDYLELDDEPEGESGRHGGHEYGCVVRFPAISSIFLAVLPFHLSPPTPFFPQLATLATHPHLFQSPSISPTLPRLIHH
jgi:hypothetical protein